MERNIRLTLAYDGTDFHGWQKQPGLRTVQETVQDVVQRICGHPLVIHGASRTDAGVHARGQTANFATLCSIPVEKLALAIGHRLPADVGLVHACEVSRAFHSSRGAECKLYRYRLHHSRGRPVEGLSQRYSWHVWHRLNADVLRAAARELVGTHDFAGFASAGNVRATTVRTISAAHIGEHFREIHVDFVGDGFLYNQVRNMVGTLVEIGRGHWPVERIAQIVREKDRRLAGPTAPPSGLSLEWIRY